MTQSSGQVPFRQAHAARFALLAVIWGASYLLIKYAVEDLSPPAVVFLRTAVATACLLAYMSLRERPDLTAAMADIRARPGTALLLAATGVAAPFLLITTGELWVDSGVAAVLVASVPIFLGLMAPAFDRGEIPGRLQWVGLLLGIAGVALVVGAETVHSGEEFVGSVAVLGAAALYALSGVIVKLRYAGTSAVGVSLIEISLSSVLMLPAALAFAPTEMPGIRALSAVVVLGAMGTAFAFVVFYRVFADVGATRSSLVAYLIPPVSVALGALLLDERLRMGGIVGTLMVLAGTALAARRNRPPQVVVEAG